MALCIVIYDIVYVQYSLSGLNTIIHNVSCMCSLICICMNNLYIGYLCIIIN